MEENGNCQNKRAEAYQGALHKAWAWSRFFYYRLYSSLESLLSSLPKSWDCLKMNVCCFVNKHCFSIKSAKIK